MEKQKIGKKGLRALFFAFVAMAFVAFVACGEDEYYDDGKADITTFSTTVRKDLPEDTVPDKKTPTMEFYINPSRKTEGNLLTITDTVGERTTKVSWAQPGTAKLTLAQKNYTTEMKYKHLNVEFSNAHMTIERDEIKVGDDVKHITHCSFQMADGNIGHIEAESWQLVRTVNGTEHSFEWAYLKSVEIISLNNITKTRGTYVADSCYTEAKAILHYVYQNSDAPAFDAILTDECFRRFLADDDVKSWSFDSISRDPENATDETYYFRKIAHMLSGEKKYLEKSLIGHYLVEGKEEYELECGGFGFGFNGTNGVSYGDTKLERIDGPWTVSRRTFSYGSGFVTPQGDRITTVYKGYTEGAVYDDGDVRVEFPVLGIEISEGNTYVESLAGDDSYDRARFHNSIRANYQGYSQNVSETVLLRKQKPVVIPEEKPNVPEPDPETFFGKLESIPQIVVNNPDRTDYWYGLLAHEQGGYVIPGIWTKSGEIQWFMDQKQQSASASNLNGCAYEHKSGRWVPVHAWDSPDLLQYDAEGANADNQSYVVAMQWNWDEGRKVNGHPSVTTSRITITMSNGVVTAVDSYTGASLGSWTYKQ